MNDLDFMWRGGYVQRYHTHPTLTTDTVGHHSYNVACIIMHVHPGASVALLRAALMHDVAEHKVGDMPAPAKRAMPDYIADGESRFMTETFREVFAEVEVAHMAAAGLVYPTLAPQEEWLLKLADSLDGMRFCLHERGMGNRHIVEVYENFRDYVSELLANSQCPTMACRVSLLFNEMLRRWENVHGE